MVNESRELTVNSNNPNKLTVENATPWLEQDDRQPRAVAEGLAERNGRPELSHRRGLYPA